MPTTEQPQEIYLTTVQLCARWACSKMFIERAVRDTEKYPNFPKPMKLGADRRWALSAVLAWEKQQSTMA